MSDPQRTDSARPATKTLPPRPARRLSSLLAVVLLAGLGYGSWRGLHWALDTVHALSGQHETLERLSRELQSMREQAQTLATRETRLSEAVARNGTDVAAVNGRVEASEQAVSRLGDVVEAGRSRIQLAAVEQLLLLANDRLQLARDSASALKALDLADQRLVLLNDPKLFKVREALAKERNALAALNLPDYTGLSLVVSELQKNASVLPLLVHVPDRFTAPDVPAPPVAAESFFGRIWASVKLALSKLFALRRTDARSVRLLAPDEEAMVRQILELRLEGARLALLAGDGRTFQELAGAAASWIRQYYDDSDLRVKTVLAELLRLQGLKLAPALPDISHSLAALRAQLGTR